MALPGHFFIFNHSSLQVWGTQRFVDKAASARRVDDTGAKASTQSPSICSGGLKSKVEAEAQPVVGFTPLVNYHDTSEPLSRANLVSF